MYLFVRTDFSNYTITHIYFSFIIFCHIYFDRVHMTKVGNYRCRVKMEKLVVLNFSGADKAVCVCLPVSIFSRYKILVMEYPPLNML